MKQAEKIWDTWEVGAYVGNNRSHGRVTIEPTWYLNKTGKIFGAARRGPFRWYQNADNDQVEIELPTVKSINIDRSIDTDIATCEIAMYNQWMNDNGQLPELRTQLGTPGYFSMGHGNNPEAVSRWNQQFNDWEGVILPNALIRTYQGYGGYNPDGSPKPIDECIAEGSLVLTGAWLVDTVTMGTNAMINIRSRDVGKLLGVQQYFPPTIPKDQYLTEWCRWDYIDVDMRYNPRPPIVTGEMATVIPQYHDSTGDHWYGGPGSNSNIHGHVPTDSLDGNVDTFALSVGNYNSAAPYCADWFEYTVHGKINEVYVHPWAGNYQMYISILENGVWVDNGEGYIFHDMTDINAAQPGSPTDTDANITFALQTGVPWESGQWYTLPRTFQAERVRITFRNHTYSEWGPYHYRCGIREVAMRVNTIVTSPPADPWTFSIEAYNDTAAPNEAGYWVVADDGQVFAFGDARTHAKVDPSAIENTAYSPIVDMTSTPTGQGYWLLQANGKVHAYGDAAVWSDATTANNFISIASTNTGGGFYLLQRDGGVWAYGDAVYYGNAVPSGLIDDAYAYTGTGIATSPVDDGYWITDGNGQVQAFGGLTDHGGITPFRSGLMPTEWVRSIKAARDGSGYWLLGGSGDVYAKGGAPVYGSPLYPEQPTDNMVLYEEFRKVTWSMAPTADGLGYYILQANGHILGMGDYQLFGEPGAVGQQRIDGNYKDYADIVKYLLAWAGFLYYTDDETFEEEATTNAAGGKPAPGLPPIYGNIENTGAYADQCLNLSVFDKKTLLDCINSLKEIVGYIFYIDDEGGARFESPNWWSIGNFWQDGTPTDFMPEVDEKSVLTDYSVTFSDESARSEIIISTEDPIQGNKDTHVTRLIPETSLILRGIDKVAMWTNEVFKNLDEQRIMAELISLHIWFQQRVGNVTALANPCIQINDQVRILERITAETYIHYVRGVSTTHDLDTGQYMMTLTTHWMGDQDDWVITKDKFPTDEVLQFDKKVRISDDLLEWVKTTNSRSAKVAALNDFDSTPTDAYSVEGSTDPDGGIGAANG